MEKKKKKRQMLCNFVCILWVCDPFKLFEFFFMEGRGGIFLKEEIRGMLFSGCRVYCRGGDGLLKGRVCKFEWVCNGIWPNHQKQQKEKKRFIQFSLIFAESYFFNFDIILTF